MPIIRPLAATGMPARLVTFVLPVHVSQEEQRSTVMMEILARMMRVMRQPDVVIPIIRLLVMMEPSAQQATLAPLEHAPEQRLVAMTAIPARTIRVIPRPDAHIPIIPFLAMMGIYARLKIRV